jgi:non-homologous end joining protein Ku
MRRVHEKIRNRQTHSLDVEEPARDESPKAPVIDLMAALKASLNKSGDARARKVAAASGKTRKRAS